jgi:phenylpropionate dioxygenase-like ring-hydroxylating dioxygenase large terminal subunit
MSETPLREGWYAVAESRQLRRRPLRRIFNGLPIVLWRTPGGVAALPDRCPHRGAVLSAGRVIGGDIACPYHGWRFNADGACTATPALAERVLNAPVRPLAAAETDGLVFVRHGQAGDATPAFAPLMPFGSAVSRMRGEVLTTLPDVAENILDTTHTGVVHETFLRLAEGRRVTPTVVVGPDSVEAHYPQQASPSGMVGRLIGGPKYRIVDRFCAPAQAEVEYWDGTRLAFAIRFHLTPSTTDKVAIFMMMAVAPSIFAPLQRAALMIFFARIFGEDQVILQAISRNRAAFPPADVILAPQDLLRPGIEAILRGEAPGAPPPSPTMLI